MKLIDDRDARTKKRQKAKEKLDKQITLSTAPEDRTCKLSLNRSEGMVRLLDEGSIVMADGNLDFYIKKGAIKKYANGKNTKLTPRYIYGDYAEKLFDKPDEPWNLNEKYEGTINVGHHNFAEFPFIVGNFKQEDLKVVNNDNGRKGLDVELKLNEAHPFVQAFRVQGIPLGVSVEMYLHWDDKATQEESEKRGEYTPIVDELFVKDFAIVGECGNVGSSGSVDLQGVKMEDSVKDIEEIEDTKVEDTEDVKDTEDTEAVGEDITDDAKVTEEEPETDDESDEDESDDEGIDEEAEDDEEDEDEEDALKVAEEAINALKAENEQLKAQVEALKKSNNKKEKKIRDYAEKDAEFIERFKGLNVSLGVTKEVKNEESLHKLYKTGDGIGE